MSIIHEALKKASGKKHEIEGNISNLSAADTSLTTEALSDKNNTAEKEYLSKLKNQKKFKVLGYLTAVIAFFGLSFLGYTNTKNYFTNSGAVLHNQTVTPSADLATLKIQPGIVLPANKNTTEQFILSGIVYEDSEPMAIINNTIYTAGETVNNAKIIEITEKTVFLDNNGEKIELRVK